MNYNTGDLVLNLTDVKQWVDMYQNKKELFLSDVYKTVKESDSKHFILGNQFKSPKTQLFSDNLFNIYVFNQNGSCDIEPNIRLYNIGQDKDDFLKEVAYRLNRREKLYGKISDQEFFSVYIPLMQEATIAHFGAMLR